ncbi:hypothetical protein [Clostridium estertheticum]|nr:hypothetical protein [Clostridium estertheticum]
MFLKVKGHIPILELEDEDKPYFKDKCVWEKYDPIYVAKTII